MNTHAAQGLPEIVKAKVLDLCKVKANSFHNQRMLAMHNFLVFRLYR